MKKKNNLSLIIVLLLLLVIFMFIKSRKLNFSSESQSIVLEETTKIRYQPTIVSDKPDVPIKKHKNAFCLLTVKPSDEWLDFLNTFTNDYDVFVVFDNNDINIDEIVKKYNNITFIRYNTRFIHTKGYWDSAYTTGRTYTSWDKGFYYFCEVNTAYDNVWFCEDDVYIPNVQSIVDIDTKYNQDLLGTYEKYNYDGNLDNPNWWVWYRSTSFKLPWVSHLVCICRVSNQLLKKVKEYANKYKRLEFIETMLSSLAGNNGMSVKAVPEFDIKMNLFAGEFDNNVNCCARIDGDNLDKIDPNIIHHPVKNVQDHVTIRNKLNK
jgi:hypothetical protein